MTDTSISRIQQILENCLFNDGSNVKSRSSKIVINKGNVGFSVDITGIDLDSAQKIRTQLEDQIKKIANFGKINIVLTSSKPSDSKDEKNSRIIVDGARKTILVASGKGGVGKSTIASLLAYKLLSEGKKVGIIDADIYGPSIPGIFNISKKPELEDNRMIPLYKNGIYLNSIGFLTAQDASISWRGPMASKALYQLISLTKWPDLDYLIIDTPPGTGDIHLSLLQNYDINGVVMVTTPQLISKLDVQRAINLYKKFNVPLLGIIENMSYYQDKLNGNSILLFQGNSGNKIAAENNIPLLAKVPIEPELSQYCDQGNDLAPFVHLVPEIKFSRAGD